MNIIKLFPKPIRKSFLLNIYGKGVKNPEQYLINLFMGTLILSAIITALLTFFYLSNPLTPTPLYIFLGSFFGLMVIFYFQSSIAASARIHRMETIFPDFVQLMSSNLRAGMTIDRAFLISARKEFYPLDEEIIKTGNEISTGKDVAQAFLSMSRRINSEKITKTIILIISGLRAGGNISALLEQTSSNMREKEFIEKKASSSILMYVIFIMFAVGAGAPVLFGLSSVLVEIIIKIVGSLPTVQNTSMATPFTFKAIGVSTSFIFYFALTFILCTDLLACLLVGLVNKGEEKAGLRFLLPLVAFSLAAFFGVRYIMGTFLAQTFSSIT